MVYQGSDQFHHWWTRRATEEHFDPSALAVQFAPYYKTGQRIEVRTDYPGGETYLRQGYVGVTTGRCPVFLLMSSKQAMGSSDTLAATDTILRVVPDSELKHYSVSVTWQVKGTRHIQAESREAAERIAEDLQYDTNFWEPTAVDETFTIEDEESDEHTV